MRKKPFSRKLVFKKWVGNIKAMAHNGMRTVGRKAFLFFARAEKKVTVKRISSHPHAYGINIVS